METQRLPSVLLVEDSPTQMAYFRNALETAGFQVRGAKNGAEALICLGEEMSEIVISDCDMPLLDGFQLCRLLKDHPTTRHIPFLLLTGNPSRLSRFWARTCGADQFLLKEGNQDALLETVRVLIDRAQAHQTEVDSGIWDMGLRRLSPLRVEDIAVQLSMALEHRLLEITVRNTVSSLKGQIHDPRQVVWGFLNLLRDLVSPGAIYFLCPETSHKALCGVLTSPSIPEATLQAFLSVLQEHPCLDGQPLEIDRRTMDWEPSRPAGLITKHFSLAVPACGIEAQWGLLIERSTYLLHRALFKEASAEIQTVVHVMAALQHIEDANRKLRQADEAKTGFVLTLSHDMRSPLGGLQVALDAMKRQEATLPPKCRNWVDVGLKSVERLIRMVNGVLDLEKIESGSFTFQPVRTETSLMVLEALRAMEPLAHARQIRLAFQNENPEGCRIEVDPDRFQQVMVNLLSNAIKFSPDGGDVQIGLARQAERVAISVSDQGAGIPEAFKGRIFGKFQQAERKASGTGLGLAITKQLVEHMGGTIGFDSEEGQGTTFTVQFPASPA